MKKLLVYIICILSFCYHVKAQEKVNGNESALEKDLKNLIAKNGDFDAYKKDKIGNYENLNEYSTNITPTSTTRKFSIVENSNSHTSVFVYEVNQKSDAALFNAELEVLFFDKTKGFTRSNYIDQDGLTEGTLSYNGKVIGFLKITEFIKYELKIILLVGNLNNKDRRNYISAKAVQSTKIGDTIKYITTQKEQQPEDRGLLNDQRTIIFEPDYKAYANLKNDHLITVNIIIDEKGNVIFSEAEGDDRFLRILCSNKAKQTKFAPYIVNGKAVKFKGYLTFKFLKKLS